MANQEPLNKIGLIIKDAREQRGLSQDELAYESRVSVAHLKNIEAGKRKELPEEAYLLGYISKILKALNFENPDALIEKYKKEEGSYIVQSIVNSHDGNETKFGFGFADFKIYHLYTILVIALVFLAWLTISNYSKNNIALDQIKLDTTEDDAKSGIGFRTTLNGVINGTELQTNGDLHDNSPTAIHRTITNGKGSKVISLEAVNDAWYQLIGVAQQKILYEGNVGPGADFDHFKFYDEQGFVLATGDAGAFLVDTGNGPFKLGKPHETIKWYFPQNARRIYKAWGENVQASKPDPVTVIGSVPSSISNSDLITLGSFETNEVKNEVTTETNTSSGLQEQALVDTTVPKKVVSSEPVNDEVQPPAVKKVPAPTVYSSPKPALIKPETKQEMKKRKKLEEKKRKERERELERRRN